MTSCKSANKHMHPKPNKSKKARKSTKVNKKSAKGSRKGSQKGRKGSQKGRKGSRKGRKGSRKGKKALGRFNQLKSMIESRLGISREVEPPKYLEEQTLDMANSDDYPEDCPALRHGDPKPCNESTTEERKRSYKQQVMKYHPDKNQKCKEIADSKFKQLANCCDPNNDYNPVPGKC